MCVSIFPCEIHEPKSSCILLSTYTKEHLLLTGIFALVVPVF